MLERMDLLIIDTIARTGTVTRAAEELHLTQSALSHAIKRLESQTGVQFWQKSGRTLVLTQAGERLLAFARRVLPQFEHMEQEIKAYAAGEQGKLRIGMECYPCFQWLLKIVAPFLKAFPNVDVDVLKEFQFGGMAALFNYDVDILVTPDPIFKEGVEYLPVFEYEQVLVTAKDHELAVKEHIVAQDLKQQTLITYPVENSRLDIFTQLLLPENCGVHKHKKVETTEIILQMVEANRGVTVLPRWLVEEQNEGFDLCAIKIGPVGLRKHIYLGLREETQQPKYIQHFMKMAQAQSDKPMI